MGLPPNDQLNIWALQPNESHQEAALPPPRRAAPRATGGVSRLDGHPNASVPEDAFLAKIQRHREEDHPHQHGRVVPASAARPQQTLPRHQDPRPEPQQPTHECSSFSNNDLVEAFKQKIQAHHTKKCYRFRMSYLRKMAIPPVQIPESLNQTRAVRVLVAGKKVPLTKKMFQNQKKIQKVGHLYGINERLQYQFP